MSLRLDPPPPVDGHWSLTLYPTATGFLYPNEIDRYAIAATTPGLEYDTDGSLTVVIGHDRPANAANWLPAPAGRFYLDLRTWGPSAEVYRREWRPGPVTPVAVTAAAVRPPRRLQLNSDHPDAGGHGAPPYSEDKELDMTSVQGYCDIHTPRPRLWR